MKKMGNACNLFTKLAFTVFVEDKQLDKIEISC